MDEGPQLRCTAFEGHRRIAAGSLLEVALALKELADRPAGGPVLVFDDATGKVLDLDLRGAPDDVRTGLADHPVVVAGFEEAIRALFAGDRERFTAQTRAWPADLRDHSTRLAADALRAPPPVGAPDPDRTAP